MGRALPVGASAQRTPTTDVVLEQQAADREQQYQRADQDEPELDERQAETDDGRRPGQGHRPVAARAEEPEVTGRFGDLGVAAVLRARVDPAGDEPEEPARDAQ